MDKNFDDLVDVFKKRVYSAGKGNVRFEVLQYDINLGIPELFTSSHLRVLDAGGGMGQMSAWLAQEGNVVSLCDVSAQMLEEAKNLFNSLNLDNIPSIYNIPIQKLSDTFKQNSFDVILLHGVIEWMDEPLEAIKCLIPLLKQGGAFSILVHNLDKVILKWGINGQYENAITGTPKRVRKLTPFNSLSGKCLEDFFSRETSLKLVSKAGIRIFYGFFEKLTKEVCNDTFLLEKKYCRIEPFASLGEHTHYILRKV